MRQCFVIAAIFCLAIACSKDNNEPLRKFTSFRVDGRIIIAENPSAVLTPADLTDSDPANDFPSLKITATSSAGDQLTFSLISQTYPFKTGAYLSTQQGNGMFIHYNDSAYTMLADNNNGYLAFNLVTVKDSLIEGNFSGLLEDTSGTLSIRPVTDGYLRAIIKAN